MDKENDRRLPAPESSGNRGEIDFGEIVHSLPCGVLITDSEGTVCYNNDSAARLLNRENQDLNGTIPEWPLTEGFHEIKMGNKSIGVRVHSIDIGEKPLWLVIMFDFTSIKHTIEKGQKLLERTIKTQEKEAQSISRLLHDDVAGSLTATKIFLSRWSKKAGKEFTDEFIEEERRLSDVMNVINEVSYALQPNILNEFGLVETLFAFFNRFTRTTRVKVRFTYSPIPKRYPDNIENTAYRIVREALDNVARHAGTDEVKVDLSKTRNILLITIEDEGKGFDSDDASLTGSGLQSIKDQAFLAGGHLEIVSVPDYGMCIRCELSLH